MGNRRLIQNFTILLLFSTLYLGSCKKNIDKDTDKQQKIDIKVPNFNADRAYDFIAKQVSFGPRVPGTNAHTLCGNWLINKLDSLADTVYVQTFKARIYSGEIKEGKNIIAQFNPSLQKRILLSAHWDSRPYADYDPDPNNHNTPIPGANDGASGVGILLELANLLNENSPSIGIDIAFWDIEDWGEPRSVQSSNGEFWCLGSQYWSRNRLPFNYNANYGILLDMVGASNATFYYEGISNEYAPSILKKVWDIAAKLGYNKYFIPENAAPITDDHLYLNTIANIPTIDIIHQDKNSSTGFFPYWHTVGDDLDKIDKNTLSAVGSVLAYLIYNEK